MARAFTKNLSEVSAGFPGVVYTPRERLNLANDHPEITETFTIPASGIVELDFAILQQVGCTIVDTTETPDLELAEVPFELAPGVAEVGVHFDGGWLKFHASRVGHAGSITYHPLGSVSTSNFECVIQKELRAVQEYALSIGGGSGSQVFEVSADGSREYTTIQAALAAATNATVEKVIRVYPGTYDVGTHSAASPIIVSVAKTHLVGMDRKSCVVTGAVSQATLKTSVIHFGADDCSISNITVRNLGLNYGGTGKFQALSVGEPDTPTPSANNFRATNCNFIGEYLDSGYAQPAADVVLINFSAHNAEFENCYFCGLYDVCASFAPTAHIRNCHVDANGAAYFLQSRPGADYDPEGMGYLYPELFVTGGTVKGGSIITLGNGFAYLYNIGTTNWGGSPPDLYEILPAGTSFNNIYTAAVATTGFGSNSASNPVSISHSRISGSLSPTQINPAISDTEFGYLSNLTGNVQTQLDAKHKIGTPRTVTASGAILSTDRLVIVDCVEGSFTLPDASTMIGETIKFVGGPNALDCFFVAASGDSIAYSASMDWTDFVFGAPGVVGLLTSIGVNQWVWEQ